MSVKSYIESNKDRFVEELFSLIRIPSISAKQEHQSDMWACAQRWAELLCASGADRAIQPMRDPHEDISWLLILLFQPSL